MQQEKRPLEDLAYMLGRRFAEERERLRETASAAIADLTAWKAAAALEINERLAAVKDGEPGLSGLPGEKGEAGESGKDGKDGEDGKEGPPGKDGQDGEKGEPGQQGQTGDPGPRGERGEPGPQGTFLSPEAWVERIYYQGELTFRDGSTFCARRDTAQPPPHDDWAPVALRGADGISGEARGLYDANEQYRKLDRVSFNGSEWIARCDAPGRLPGDGWMLSAQAKRGKPGEKGDLGPRGPAGIGLDDIGLEDWSLVLELTGGRRRLIDLRPLFDRYDQERGG
jgi:Collagen triple helix repeat (20 copies)